MYFRGLLGKEKFRDCWQGWRKSLYRPTQPGYFLFFLLNAAGFCGRSMEEPGAEFITWSKDARGQQPGVGIEGDLCKQN